MKVLARPESGGGGPAPCCAAGSAGSLDDPRELGDAELVASELVSNSIRHAGLSAHEVVRVRAAALDDVLHLEVEDDGRAGPPRRRPPDPITGGIGLNVVEALSQAWGVRREARTTVWAELPFHPTG